jgi:hypothetical protein
MVYAAEKNFPRSKKNSQPRNNNLVGGFKHLEKY